MRRGPTRADVETAIERSKREIADDVFEGWVPVGVPDFSALHDYRDANGYGGFFEDDTVFYRGIGEGFFEEANAVQDAVDAWIRAGGLREAVAVRITEGAVVPPVLNLLRGAPRL